MLSSLCRVTLSKQLEHRTQATTSNDESQTSVADLVTFDRLAKAVEAGDSATLRRIVAAGRNFEYLTAEGSLLYHAVKCRAPLWFLEELLELEANPNYFSYEDHQTALHLAAREGNVAALEVLLDYGGSPVELDVAGRTVVDVARTSGHSQCIELLERIMRLQRDLQLHELSSMSGTGKICERHRLSTITERSEPFSEVAPSTTRDTANDSMNSVNSASDTMNCAFCLEASLQAELSNVSDLAATSPPSKLYLSRRSPLGSIENSPELQGVTPLRATRGVRRRLTDNASFHEPLDGNSKTAKGVTVEMGHQPEADLHPVDCDGAAEATGKNNGEIASTAPATATPATTPTATTLNGMVHGLRDGLGKVAAGILAYLSPEKRPTPDADAPQVNGGQGDGLPTTENRAASMRNLSRTKAAAAAEAPFVVGAGDGKCVVSSSGSDNSTSFDSAKTTASEENENDNDDDDTHDDDDDDDDDDHAYSRTSAELDDLSWTRDADYYHQHHDHHHHYRDMIVAGPPDRNIDLHRLNADNEQAVRWPAATSTSSHPHPHLHHHHHRRRENVVAAAEDARPASYPSSLFTEDITFDRESRYIRAGSTASTRTPLPESIEGLSDEELFEQLAALGMNPAPINDAVRSIYLHQLAHLRLGNDVHLSIRPHDGDSCLTDSSFRSAQQQTGSQREAEVHCCEVLHRDLESGLMLREEHYGTKRSLLPPNVVQASPSQAIPPELVRLSNDEVRERLVELGENPGPVNRHTRAVYLRQLHRLQQASVATPSPSQLRSVLPPELHQLCLRFSQAFETYSSLETQMEESFRRTGQRWREGCAKTAFTYLLLDSSVTLNLPARAAHMSLPEQMETFVKATFYVGKGKRSRPFSHLYEALDVRGKLAKLGDTAQATPQRYANAPKVSAKVKRILKIWSQGHGVISLHVFQNIIPVEAYTREGAMIEALGINRLLTNEKRGEFYGVADTWTTRQRKQLGAYLVYRAMQVFLAEGERRLGPLDL